MTTNYTAFNASTSSTQV